jgi:hypothetical protein
MGPLPAPPPATEERITRKGPDYVALLGGREVARGDNAYQLVEQAWPDAAAPLTARLEVVTVIAGVLVVVMARNAGRLRPGCPLRPAGQAPQPRPKRSPSADDDWCERVTAAVIAEMAAANEARRAALGDEAPEDDEPAEPPARADAARLAVSGPTGASPGTVEKVRFLARRRRQGLPLFHPDDAPAPPATDAFEALLEALARQHGRYRGALIGDAV